MSDPLTEMFRDIREENTRLREKVAKLREVLKLALACEPNDWAIWHDQACAALSETEEK